MREGWQLRHECVAETGCRRRGERRGKSAKCLGTRVVPLTISLACQAAVSTGVMPRAASLADAISKRAKLINQSRAPSYRNSLH